MRLGMQYRDTTEILDGNGLQFCPIGVAAVIHLPILYGLFQIMPTWSIFNLLLEEQWTHNTDGGFEEEIDITVERDKFSA